MLFFIEAFVLAFVGCIATNIDNILLVLSSGNPHRARQTVLVFIVTLEVYILLALAMSYGIDLTIPRFIVWLGLIPLSIGIYELRPGRKLHGDGSKTSTVSLTALGITLAVNSFDTLIVQMVLFSDFATQYHLAALAGATAAAVVLGLTAFLLLTRPASAEKLLPIASRARPWILIAVGVLILMDTGFDVQ